MTFEELLRRIDMIRDECSDRAGDRMSGYISPTDADLAREEGARDVSRDIADTLAQLLAEARQAS